MNTYIAAAFFLSFFHFVYMRCKGLSCELIETADFYRDILFKLNI